MSARSLRTMEDLIGKMVISQKPVGKHTEGYLGEKQILGKKNSKWKELVLVLFPE